MQKISHTMTCAATTIYSVVEHMLVRLNRPQKRSNTRVISHSTKIRLGSLYEKKTITVLWRNMLDANIILLNTSSKMLKKYFLCFHAGVISVEGRVFGRLNEVP